MLRFFTVVTFLGAVVAFFTLLAAVGSNDAGRTAAYSAMALALVGLPYCVTRTLWMLKQRDDTTVIYKALLQIRDNTQANDPA